MAANGDTQTVSEYIVHHLTNLTYGKLPGGYERYDGSIVPEAGQWTMAHGADEMSAMGFNAVHVDSMIWSVGPWPDLLLGVSAGGGSRFRRRAHGAREFYRNDRGIR